MSCKLAENSVIMKFLFGVLLIASVVICASADDMNNQTDPSTANTTTATSTSPDGSNGAGTNTTGATNPTSPSNETTEATTTSSASAISMTQCFPQAVLLAVLVKL
ncbi:hypothetical protein SprV_0401428900 [Sparganum proliferum]